MTENYNLPKPSFRSRKAFINYMHKTRALKEARGDFESETSYIKNFLPYHKDGNSFAFALVGLANITHSRLYLDMAEILENKEGAIDQYCNVWVQHLLLVQLDYFNFTYAKWKNPEISLAERFNLPRLIPDIVPMLAIFGNRRLFESSLNLVLEAFDKGMFANSITFITQLFLLQLAEEFMGYPTRDWKSYLDVDPRQVEPLFNELWQHWDTEDVTQLEPLLILLLNRHTYKASRDNPDGGRDFYGHSEQFPMEVLFICRLREWKGLTNPRIKHRLTEPPFHELPEPLEKIEFDELTLNFVKEIRSVFPDMDQSLAAMRTRDWEMLL